MNEFVNIAFPHNITLSVKREDLLHPQISGNKFRKLKYNILEAKAQGNDKLLTFGGAFSNHIAATAAAGKKYGFTTIGVIRGEELRDKVNENPTLAFAGNCGMELHFISREDYRKKEDAGFLAGLSEMFGDFYLLPEGGSNALAVKGCEEILSAEDYVFTHICCAVGTGCTLAGIINSAQPHQKVIGFPALKHEGVTADVERFTDKKDWEIRQGYDFGGYAKVNEQLVTFINNFYDTTGIPLDPVYTGKLFFGVTDSIEKGYFPESSQLLLVHTGGLQGIAGINELLKKRKLPIIKT